MSTYTQYIPVLRDSSGIIEPQSYDWQDLGEFEYGTSTVIAVSSEAVAGWGTARAVATVRLAGLNGEDPTDLTAFVR